MKKILLALAVVFCATIPAIAQTAISALPSATTPLTGSEVVAGVQGGTTKQIPVTAIGVQGPASAIDSHLALFDGATGKLIKDGGVPNAGTVTSITCFGVAITTSGTCATTGQIPGTSTNDSASAGKVGETPVGASSTLSVTTAALTDITSLSLTAGQWLVWGAIEPLAASGTVIAGASGWISTTSATDPGFPNGGAYAAHNATNTSGPNFEVYPVGQMVLKLSGTTTVYLTCVLNFTVSTAQCGGSLFAARMR